ncbi:LmrA/YxaF family transcription factor [Tsukamurella soli]|uniref:LmrA/YxaF family transcription factor n=1 Tax=Tsukamurella soli TaxID=644556 RepID=UPI003612608C
MAAALGSKPPGPPAADAAALAGVAVSTLEGAIAISRATRSTRPLDDAGAILVRLLGADAPAR